jgi:hypothetical protein
MPHDWRDSLRLAGDLALLGIIVTVLCLPVVTAGAAVATASATLSHLFTEGRWLTLAENATVFRARLVPGLVAGPAVLVAAVLFAVDVAALRRGAVPGGAPALTAVLLIAALAAGWVALVAVRGGGPRATLALAASRPLLLLAAAGVVMFAALLATLIHPVLTPVLAGYALFAVHAVHRRFTVGPLPRPAEEPPAAR